MTSTQLDIIAPLDTPLPPLADGHVLTETQWTTLVCTCPSRYAFGQANREPRNVVSELPCSSGKYIADLEKCHRWQSQMQLFHPLKSLQPFRTAASVSHHLNMPPPLGQSANVCLLRQSPTLHNGSFRKMQARCLVSGSLYRGYWENT